MDTNAQIIKDLHDKIGFEQALDFLSEWKGVPVMIRGHLQEVRPVSILFKVGPPDSICLAQEENVLILHDIFISGIRGEILAYDPQNGTVELGNFIYIDRGFGDREIVRVEPDAPIEATLSADEISFGVSVIDVSLSGFGILAEAPQGKALTKGQPLKLKLSLLDQEIEIPSNLLGVFLQGENVRLAVSFPFEVSGNAVITRYITRRRAEIRQEIQAAYQQALESNN